RVAKMAELSPQAKCPVRQRLDHQRLYLFRLYPFHLPEVLVVEHYSCFVWWSTSGGRLFCRYPPAHIGFRKPQIFSTDPPRERKCGGVSVEPARVYIHERGGFFGGQQCVRARYIAAIGECRGEFFADD